MNVERANTFSTAQKVEEAFRGLKIPKAFTLLELVVVIGAIAILAALAVPALTSSLKKAQMTGTMNNARQLYLAQFAMANDGAATGDANLTWPGDQNPAPRTLPAYVNTLVAPGYLRGADIVKLFSAPDCNLTVTVADGPPEAVTFTGGTAALKVYPLRSVDPPNTIFCTSKNYDYDTALVGTNVPYGTKGFIVTHKGGDAAVLKEGQATLAEWGGNEMEFQKAIGAKPGETVGTVTPGDPAGTLKFPPLLVPGYRTPEETPPAHEIETYVSRDVFVRGSLSEVSATVEKSFRTVSGTIEKSTPPEVSGTDTIERVPHLDVSSGSDSDLNISVYATAQVEREGETGERILLTVPNYVLTCNLNVWLDTSSNLTIRGPVQSSITITRGVAESTKATFVVVKNADASPDEECFLTAYFSYNGRPAGSVQRRAKLGDVEKLFVPARPESITIEPLAPQPDITIGVVRKGSRYICHFSTPLLDEFRADQCETWELPQETSDLVSSFFQAFLNNKDFKQKRQSLIGGGKQLFKSLPKPCREMFWKLNETKAKTMLVVSQEPFIPWELMVPTKKQADGSVEVQQPLGVRYAVGRWVLSSDDYSTPRSQMISVSQSYVVAPPYGAGEALDAAHDEAKFVRDNFAGTEITPADPDHIEDAIKNGGRKLLHFACHNEGSGNKVGRQILKLQNGTFLDSTMLGGMDGMQEGFNTTKPFVFINACMAGQTILSLSGVGGLANSFIDLGASAVVAPLWDVNDTIAHEVAVTFYKEVKNYPTHSLAEIVQGIRGTAYNNPSLHGYETWAAYCFYGDPYTTIRFAPSP